MAQYGRPSTDTLKVDWTGDPDNTDLFNNIDEDTPDDNDFIASKSAPSGAPYVTKLTSIEDPVVDTGHVIRYRYQKNAAGGAQINLVVQLRQGYVNEGNQGTLIKEWTHNNIPNGFVQANNTLTEEEAGNITDYASLFLRFVPTQV